MGAFTEEAGTKVGTNEAGPSRHKRSHLVVKLHYALLTPGSGDLGSGGFCDRVLERDSLDDLGRVIFEIVPLELRKPKCRTCSGRALISKFVAADEEAPLWELGCCSKEELLDLNLRPLSLFPRKDKSAQKARFLVEPMVRGAIERDLNRQTFDDF